MSGIVPLVLVSFPSQQNKFSGLQYERGTTTSSIQREVNVMRRLLISTRPKSKTLYGHRRPGTDEQTERHATSSLVDIEQNYTKLIEGKIPLEHELKDKAAVEEACQHLRDELRGKGSRRPLFTTI